MNRPAAPADAPWPYDPALRTPAAFERLWARSARFRAFSAQVYAYLDAQRPGTRLRLDRYQGEALEWVVAVCVAYVSEPVGGFTHRFAPDWRSITRLHVTPAELERHCRWWQCRPG